MDKIKNADKGFTLIELLVVILIIGILAAIALPQYQIAIDKTTFSKFELIVKNIDDAYQRYYLTHNDHPSNFHDLDIELPKYNSITNPSDRIVRANFDSFYCYMGKPVAHQYYGTISCVKSDESLKFIKRIFDDNAQPTKINFCVAQKDDVRANRLCNNLNYSKKEEKGEWNHYTLK